MSKADSPEPSSADGHQANRADLKKRVYLVPYPKFIFLYPTFIVTVVCAIWLFVGKYSAVGPTDVVPVVLTDIFLLVLTLNLFILVFDFPRASWLVLLFLITSVVLSAALLFTRKPEWLPIAKDLIVSLRPVANTTFFVCTSGIMGLMFFLIFVSRWLNYWELRPNELLHHHGILSDLERYPAPNLRVDKEINDVFEYMLLGSGRLILHPSSERRAIVLDNVPLVSHKERQIKKILGAIHVSVRSSETEST